MELKALEIGVSTGIRIPDGRCGAEIISGAASLREVAAKL